MQDRVDNTGALWRDGQVSPRRERSPDLYEKRDSRTLRFPNGIMPISQSKRNSLVSEPSYDEPVTEITVTNITKLPVPDVVPTRSRAVKSPPKDASTPLKGSNLNKKTEESASKTVRTQRFLLSQFFLQLQGQFLSVGNFLQSMINFRY